MKLLRIKDNLGEFLDQNGTFSPIDKIGKEDLLRLVDLVLKEQTVQFDDFNEQLLKNQAHQIIYKSILLKLRALRLRKQEFVDEAARAYLDEHEGYRA